MTKTIKRLIILALAGLFVSACKPEPAKAPRGYWEYRGQSTNGIEAIFRLSVDGGPFIRYLGTAPPPGQLMTRAQYEEMLKKFDQYWLSMPEMLTKYDNGKFIGIGGQVEGNLMFEYDPATQEIISHQPGSGGLRLKRVAFFEPMAFPEFEKKSREAGKAGWDPAGATNAP